MFPVNPNKRWQHITASAGQSVFNSNFPILDATQAAVYYTPEGQLPNDSTQLLTLNADYTLSNIGVSGGFTVTLVGFTANLNDIISLWGETEIQNTTLYSNGAPFTYQSIDSQFNYFVMMMQEINTAARQLAPHYQNTEILNLSDLIFPKLAASQFWMRSTNNAAFIAAELEPNADVNTLRSELASQIEGADGAREIGYFDVSTGTGTTVSDFLNSLPDPGDLAAFEAALASQDLSTPGSDLVGTAGQTLTSYITQTDNSISSINKGAPIYAVATGAANTYAVTVISTISSYAGGLRILAKISATNTGASTINVNSIGAANITLMSGAALPAGAMLTGMIAELVYDGTNFQLLNPLETTSDLGIVQVNTLSTPSQPGTNPTYTGDFTFSTPFPTHVVSVQAFGTTPVVAHPTVINSFSTTGFNYTVSDAGGGDLSGVYNVDWVAFGY